MNRRHFIKVSSLASFGAALTPQLVIQELNKQLSYQELIGKGNPKLYGDGFKLRKEAYESLVELSAKALESDIRLQVVSSYRGFEHQNQIWQRKYKRYINMGLSPKDTINKIIKYSTIPGTSRHHWGTDIDVIDGNVTQPKHILNPNHYEGNGCYSKFKSWMDNNAADFGFHLVYTDNKKRKGFNYEPWHFSYKPLSKSYLQQYRNITIDQIIRRENLLGHEHFNDTFIETYTKENILDINPELL